jgi:hypothetical protein
MKLALNDPDNPPTIEDDLIGLLDVLGGPNIIQQTRLSLKLATVSVREPIIEIAIDELTRIAPQIRQEIARVYGEKVANEMKIGIRGSLIKGSKSLTKIDQLTLELKPFNRNDYDIDFFLISDEIFSDLGPPAIGKSSRWVIK